MKIHEFLHRSRAERVLVTLVNGEMHSGSFRTDILTPDAIAAYFFGDIRPLALMIDEITACDALAADALAS